MSSGSKQYSASIAFTLALFSHLVNHVNIRLQAELEEAESQVPPLHTDATGERGNPYKERGGENSHCSLGSLPASIAHIDQFLLSVSYQQYPRGLKLGLLFVL